jgi:flagellar hook-length control protein FliK
VPTVSAAAVTEIASHPAGLPTTAVAPPLAEAIETLLQAQRVTVPVPAEAAVQAPVVAAEAPVIQVPAAAAQTAQAAQVQEVTKVAPLLPKAGQWLVEPLAPDAVTPDVNTVAQPSLPALADILARASIRTPAEQGSAGQGLKAKTEQQQQPDTQSQAPTASVAAFTVVHTAAAKTVAPDGAKAPAPIPSPIDPDRLMDAIAKSAVSSGDGRYTVTLRLHPEQLGEVHLQLHVVGREVQTTLQVSTPAAQQALQAKGDELRQSLDQNGLTLSGFSVNTGQGERRRDQELPDELTNRPRRKTATAPGGPAPVARSIRRQTQRTSGLDTLA